MPKIFCDANPRMIAYCIDGGGSDYQYLPDGHTIMEAEYMAVIYGLNEFFIKWNKELDARQYDMTKESAEEDDMFFKTATPSEETKRELPPPILICSDNEVVVKQLSRQYHIGNDRLRKLAQRVWDMTKNIDVKFQWVSRRENPAGKMLK